MAPKLSEIPPPADSSSEDEEETESESEEEEEEEKDRHIDAQNDDVDKQEETDDDDDEEGNESPVLKKPDTSSLSDPDLDSESTQPSPSLSAFTIKLHKPSQKPNQVGSKRSTDSESGLPAKKKSKARGDEEPKKGSAAQRLWSEGDELAILDGLVKYKSEKGADPSADMAAFHQFIKDSLHVDVSKNQLSDKIRRLKKKYRTNIERGENGQDPVSSRAHDFEAFELSKKVWGGNERNSDKNEIVKRNAKVQNSGNGSGVTLGLPSLGKGKKQISGSSNQEVKSVEKKSRVKVKKEAKTVAKIEENTVSDGKSEDEEGNVENFWEKYPFLGKSLDMVALSEDAKVILRENLGMIEKSKLKELEHKWESLTTAELELFVQRTELVTEQVKLALDSMNS